MRFLDELTGTKKGVMVSHRNVISEVLLFKHFESHTRDPDQKDVVLGLLPYSHIFGLSVFTAAVFRGETVAVLPKFELGTLLDAIQRTRINTLYLVSIWTHVISRWPGMYCWLIVPGPPNYR